MTTSAQFYKIVQVSQISPRFVSPLNKSAASASHAFRCLPLVSVYPSVYPIVTNLVTLPIRVSFILELGKLLALPARLLPFLKFCFGRQSPPLKGFTSALIRAVQSTQTMLRHIKIQLTNFATFISARLSGGALLSRLPVAFVRAVPAPRPPFDLKLYATPHADIHGNIVLDTTDLATCWTKIFWTRN